MENGKWKMESSLSPGGEGVARRRFHQPVSRRGRVRGLFSLRPARKCRIHRGKKRRDVCATHHAVLWR